MICVLFLFDDAGDDNVNTNEVLCLFLGRSFPQHLLWVHKLWGDIKGRGYILEGISDCNLTKVGGGIDRYFMAALVRIEYIYTLALINSN